jgi:hypothetical protein
MALKASARPDGGMHVGFAHISDFFYWDCFFVLVMEALGKSLKDVKKTHGSLAQHPGQVDALTVVSWARDIVSFSHLLRTVSAP